MIDSIYHLAMTRRSDPAQERDPKRRVLPGNDPELRALLDHLARILAEEYVALTQPGKRPTGPRKQQEKQ